METKWRSSRSVLAAAILLFGPLPAVAQLPFPGALPGADISGSLPSELEASGAAWHPRLYRLFVVDDGGTLNSLEADGTLGQSFPLGGDLEAVCVADPASSFVYVGVEHPDAIIEFDIDAGAASRCFDLTSILTGPQNLGLEALTFARDPAHPEGGLFYAGLQDDGRVYVLELPIASSAVLTSVTHLATLTPAPAYDDISGLDWEAESDTLYACYDTAGVVMAFDPAGVVSAEWTLPGHDQEGIALRGCRLFVAQDTGEVLVYDGFPGPEVCDTAQIDVATISVASGGTQEIEIEFGAALSGDGYILLGTLSDTLPGFLVDGVHVPLVIDAYFEYTLANPNSVPLVNSLGVLDSSGGATAEFALPIGMPPGLVGKSAYHSVVAFGTTAIAASNPVPLNLVL